MADYREFGEAAVSVIRGGAVLYQTNTQVLASLTSLTGNLALAEDAVQEASVIALAPGAQVALSLWVLCGLSVATTVFLLFTEVYASRSAGLHERRQLTESGEPGLALEQVEALTESSAQRRLLACRYS